MANSGHRMRKTNPTRQSTSDTPRRASKPVTQTGTSNPRQHSVRPKRSRTPNKNRTLNSYYTANRKSSKKK